MPSTRVRVALLAVAVALAGCAVAAPTSDGQSDETAITQVTLENSSLELDAERHFDRVERLVAENLSEYPPVYVLRGEGAGGGAFNYPYTPYEFVKHLRLTEVRPGGDGAAGLTDGFGRVYLVPGKQSRTEQVTVLVHEYVHVLQFRADMLPWSPASLQGNVPTDLAQTRLALTEGAAVWVTDRYIERYMPANVSLQSTRMEQSYEAATVGGRYFIARYHVGAQGVDRRIDEPTELRDLYAQNVPNTTEQLIHGYGPAEEPPRRFAVETSDGTDWTVTEPDDEDVMGELFVRVALSRNLTLERAAAAADGWGYDRLIEYERNDTSAFAWVTRWDDPANASEFADAFEMYRSQRDTPANLTFRVERLGPEHVVVYSGPPRFVDRAETSRTVEGVRVGVRG